MSRFGRSYAEAFLESAPSGYDVEGFLAKASALRRAVSDDARLKAFFGAPAIPADVKRKVLQDLVARVGLDDFGGRFFNVILKNRRIGSLSEILSALSEAYDRRRGIVEAQVSVAAPIGDTEKQKIETALSRQVGKRIRLRIAVDPKILAGFVARVGSEVFDASAARAIEKFQEDVKEMTKA